MDDLREDLGLRLKMPGNYLRSYVASGYSTEKQANFTPEGSTPPTAKYSKGSLEAKERAAMAELDDLNDSDGSMEGFGELLEAVGEDDGAVYDMASSNASNIGMRAAAADYDLASNDSAARTGASRAPPADYDMASGHAGEPHQ